MALKSVYGADEWDDCPEAHKELFTEVNGQWELTGIDGVKSDADMVRLKKSLQDERKAHKATTADLGKWSAFDLEDVQSKLDGWEEMEARAGGNLDDDKIADLVAKRIKAQLAPIERERDAMKESSATFEAENLGLKSKITRGKRDAAVRKACEKAATLTGAIDDAIMYGAAMLDEDDDGNFTVKEGFDVTEGANVTGWLEEMRIKLGKDHWWEGSEGGRAKGGAQGGGFAQNPFHRDHWNLTRQAEAVRADPARAEQMAKAAGVQVGAVRPIEVRKAG